MAPLVLEGETLGEKHRHYNKLLKAAVDDQATDLPPLNYEDPDVDNLLKIDVACSRRNVEYVLEVLQSDDMLYVSRAIKRGTWLITDDKYAHIINPEYLYNELFPKLTTKAQNKLLLAIRLNLKNEARVEEFFKYYSDDIKVAQKWLPHCSQATIEKVFTENPHEISLDTFKRLCESSISVLKILLNVKSWHYIGQKLEVSKILIKKYGEEYLELMKTLERHNIPNFGINATKQMMQICPDKVLQNFDKFAKHIHLPTFAKCLKKENIEEFLIKQASNKDLKHWITYDNIKHFVKYLPIATRFEFVKKLFIDKEATKPKVNTEGGMSFARMDMMECKMLAAPCGMSMPGPTTNASIYRWYRFASFETAFTDLKKLIRVESSPGERNSILTVLITCARSNPQNVKTLLQFYREKHMNEPFKFKIQFVNALVSLVDTHKFDDSTWAILNDIFSSMEVYIESENSVAFCVKAIIVYKLLHNEEIPKIIIKKLTNQTFDTFKEYRKKLDENDREKLFTYLYNIEINKLNKQSIDNEYEMTTALNLLSNVLTLLKDWEKKIADHHMILDKIRLYIKTKKEKSLNNDLTHIYDFEKRWRRAFFEESLLLDPNDKTCVHALKHDPGLLQRYNNEVMALCSNDSISLKYTLRKLRIYWAQSLAEKWIELYTERLEKPTGHKATIEGICILLPRNQFLRILEKYAPVETKIDWSNTDTAKLSLQKNIAKRMKHIRPAIQLEAALTYAKDDYLQFALPSLNAVLSNMSANEVSKCVPLLFDSPVSLKKHGVRLAYTKLKFSEIKDLVENMWKNTKNSSIKTVLFKETFELLKKAKNDSAIQDLWQLQSMFIDNLTPDENRVIYDILGKAEEIPIKVRAQFFVKGYKYLASLPAKANCEGILRQLERHAVEIMDSLEPSFVEENLLKPVPELVNIVTGESNDKTDLFDVIPTLMSYIIHSDSENAQLAKYEKYLVPMLDGCLKAWKTLKNGQYVGRNHCLQLLRCLLSFIKARATKQWELYPKIFKDIEAKLRTLPVVENYRVVTYWAIAALFVESVSNYLKDTPKPEAPGLTDKAEGAGKVNVKKVRRFPPRMDNSDKDLEVWEQICTGAAPQFGKSSLAFLKKDLASQLPSLGHYFARSLLDVFDQVPIQNAGRLHTVKHMLDGELVASYLVVLEAVHRTYYEPNENITKQLKREIYDIIKEHPSTDVQIHYRETVYSDPHHFEEAVPF